MNACSIYFGTVIDSTTIQDLVRRIAQEFKPERIVLFGSHAYGSPHQDSDVDLLVVLDFDGPAYVTAGKIRSALPSSVPLDLVVRTPRQMSEIQTGAHPAVHEALSRGVVLFQRAA